VNCVIFDLKMHQNTFAGARPRSARIRWRTCGASPDPLAGFRGGDGNGVEGEKGEREGRGKEVEV